MPTASSERSHPRIGLPRRGSRYPYTGTVRPRVYGSRTNAFGRRAHLDCLLRPRVSGELWQEVRSHCLEIDGRVIEYGPDGESLSGGNPGGGP